jgi:DNA (cytosine-5)-methyltransferase 1
MKNKGKINGLDLFSGIGGIGIGLSDYVRTIAYCEQDRYAQGVLLSRMQSNDIDRAPIFQDVRQLSKKNFITKPDIIFGGFPCQDISSAGLGAGLAGERSGLFFEIIRLTKEINPPFVFLENVPAIRTRGLREVVRAFTEIGYDCRWTCLSAASVGAPHKRERWFLMAYSDSIRQLSKQKAGQFSSNRISNGGKDVADSLGERCNKNGSRQPITQGESGTNHWAIEPNVGRVANGIPSRVDRIKCLGNSVVPIQIKTAFEKLLGLGL